MDLLDLGVICLVLNAVIHLLQYILIYKASPAQRNTATGSTSFFLVYLLLAALVWFGFRRVWGAALVLPLIGGVGLVATFRTAPGDRIVNTAIIILDIICVSIFGYLLYLVE